MNEIFWLKKLSRTFPTINEIATMLCLMSKKFSSQAESVNRHHDWPYCALNSWTHDAKCIDSNQR